MISIVIPAYEEERFLPKCLESLKNQDYKGGYEIIVVDNGSTDDTSRIARKSVAKGRFLSKEGFDARQAGVEVLPIVIENLWEQGYQFVTVPELLGVSPYH